MARAPVKSWHHLLRNGGTLEEARSLLEEGVDIEESSCYGNSPLLIAALLGNKGVFDLLLNAGAIINPRFPHNRTYLHHAARHGWLDTIQFFLDKGFDADQRDNRRDTPLMLAVWEGYEDVCELLISAGANVNASNNYNGYTPLHTVAIGVMNSIEVTNLLLKAGANYNVYNYSGETALYLLMKKNKIGAIKLCFEMGAYLDDFDSEMFQELPFFKGVLQKDTKMCTEAIINKFNKKDLPALYEVASAVILPPVDKLCIKKGSRRALEVEQSVSFEINAKGHCDVMRARPVVLSLLAVRSFLEAIKSRDTLQSLNSDQQQSSKKMRLEK